MNTKKDNLPAKGGIAMLLYSVIMFSVSVLFTVISTSIYRGNTNLIHDYHQTKVTDRKAYGKAFGKALFVVGLAPLFSGLIALTGDSKPIVITAIAVLFVGFGIGFICLWRVQKKYNQGIF